MYDFNIVTRLQDTLDKVETKIVIHVTWIWRVALLAAVVAVGLFIRQVENEYATDFEYPKPFIQDARCVFKILKQVRRIHKVQAAISKPMQLPSVTVQVLRMIAIPSIGLGQVHADSVGDNRVTAVTDI